MKKGAALAVTKAKKPYKEDADAPGPGFVSFGKAGRIMFRLPGNKPLCYCKTVVSALAISTLNFDFLLIRNYYFDFLLIRNYSNEKGLLTGLLLLVLLLLPTMREFRGGALMSITWKQVRLPY